jgi:hypothetical protein
VLRNSCRPLKRTRFVPLLLSRHSRAGLSHAATSWLESILSHRSGATSSFVTDSEQQRWGSPLPEVRMTSALLLDEMVPCS